MNNPTWRQQDIMNRVVAGFTKAQMCIIEMDDPRAEDFLIAFDELEATLINSPELKQTIEGHSLAVRTPSSINLPAEFVEDIQP